MHFREAFKHITTSVICPGLAVLVVIHGDSWLWGSSSLYDSRVLASLGQVLVVTFNYRLGIFGKKHKLCGVASGWVILRLDT